MHIEVVTLKKENITDFAKERNLLLKKAKKEWILFLDSDEALSKELKNEIERLEPDDYEGYYIYRQNYFLGKAIGTDKIVRLGKKESGKWNRKVHEAWNIKGNVGTLVNPIVHNTANNLHDYIQKLNKYSDIHLEENLKEHKNSTLFKIVFFPIAKFFQSMFMGRGIVFSMLQSFHSFLSWSKEWNLQKN